MFRLATPEDYEYLPDIGLYELTFDKRPVQGVRCEDPKQGAADYNNFRKNSRQLFTKKNNAGKIFISSLRFLGMPFLIGRLSGEHRKNVVYYRQCIMPKITKNISNYSLN